MVRTQNRTFLYISVPISALPSPACTLRLRNDLYCVGWGVKLYSLTHPACTRLKVETVAVLAQKLQHARLCTKSMGLCLH